MNHKHRETLQRIFENPVRSDIRWSDIERLILALGGFVQERRGSRVYVELKGIAAVFHRPHPQDITDRNAVRNVRAMFMKAGITDAEV